MTLSRQETTTFLGELLKRDVLIAYDQLWGSEVEYSKFDNGYGKVDYMSFVCGFNKDGISEHRIQQGWFIAYEIKSCMSDFDSGCGKNFIGDENYLVMPMELYIQLSSSSKLPDVGVYVPLPWFTRNEGKHLYRKEFQNPTPLTNDPECWRLFQAKYDSHIGSKRRYGTAELLYSILRACRKQLAAAS